MVHEFYGVLQVQEQRTQVVWKCLGAMTAVIIQLLCWGLPGR